MEGKLRVQELIDLCGLDIDAVHCYRRAVKNIEVYEMRMVLDTFLSVHERHVSDLSGLISKMGGMAPIDMPSGKFLTQKLHMVTPEERTGGTMSDMLDNEEIINQAYAEATLQDLGPEASALVKRAYAQEKGHLEYFRDAVKRRVWEKVPVTLLSR